MPSIARGTPLVVTAERNAVAVAEIKLCNIAVQWVYRSAESRLPPGSKLIYAEKQESDQFPPGNPYRWRFLNV